MYIVRRNRNNTQMSPERRLDLIFIWR